MQIWSKTKPKGLVDIRIKERPPTKHKDFEIFLTCDNVPKLPLIREQIKNQEYWDSFSKNTSNASIKPAPTSQSPVKFTPQLLGDPFYTASASYTNTSKSEPIIISLISSFFR